MSDRWDLLACAPLYLARHFTVLALIPNVRRRQQVLRPLLVHRRWDYAEFGVLERTRYRIFTRSTTVELFESTGFVISRVERIRLVPNRGRLATANGLLGDRLGNVLVERFAIVARRDG